MTENEQKRQNGRSQDHGKQKNNEKDTKRPLSSQESGTDGGDKPQGPKMPKFNAYWIYALILIALIIVSTFNLGQGPQNLSYSIFEDQLLPSGDIEKIVVVTNEGTAEVTLREDAIDKHGRRRA